VKEPEVNSNAPTCWRLARGRSLSLDRPRVLGILNVTPDSFSDGGAYLNPAAALEQALRMIDEGADGVDVGGESTRPGARPVRPEEQIRRTVPVIRRIRARSDVVISIDTTSAQVAQAALEAGADAVNDVSAGRDSEAMLPLVAEREAGIILMHRLNAPLDDSYSDEYEHAPEYRDVVTQVRDFLVERAGVAIGCGVPREAIVIDPGLGFGKTVEQNYALIARTRTLVESGYPILSAASRKSFVGRASGVENPAARVKGSVAVSVAQYLAGVRLFRVHDVRAHREALAVAQAIDSERGGACSPRTAPTIPSVHNRRP
jgi:dihydropteroate synthase